MEGFILDYCNMGERLKQNGKFVEKHWKIEGLEGGMIKSSVFASCHLQKVGSCELNI
jgi:hypothetical protein